MKKSLLSFIIIFLLMFAIQSTVKAQYILNEADAQYKLFNYKKAVDLYEQAYKKNVTLYIVRRLAQCSALMNNYKETESWCAIAINLPLSIAEDHFNYAKALQNNGEYSHAKTEYHKYAELNKGVTTEQLNFWDHCCDSAMVWMKKPGSYIIKNENRLNSIQSDWGAVTYENSIVFVSDRDDQPKNITNKNHPFLKFDGAIVPDKKHFGWTENKYLRLFTYDKSTDSITLFPIKTGTDYHVGAASFTANGNEMYFSLTRIPEGHMKGKFPNINVEIYSSTKDTAGNWSVPVSFKYNNAKEWSNGDPFITPDGKNLYFASTMPGGKGGIDLYVCHKINANEWDKPHNLFTINTLGNERSPFFDGDNLYFSSDGYVGMGGLDIFKVPYNDDKLGKPQNLGYPANSPQDDFAYNSTSDTTGFLSSNRSESLNSDDIYSFNGFKKNQSLVFALEGKVYNKTHNVIANAMVSLSKNGGTIKIETDDNGAYKFALEEK
jgi:peptidoglycan-associated lipoprotein